jgi:hypothetical protein
MTFDRFMYKAARDYLLQLMNETSWNAAAAARKAGRNRQVIYRMLHKYGINRASRRYTEAERIEWWKLYVAGVGIRQIAEKFECSYTVVRYELFGEWKPKPARLVRPSVQQELRA